MCQMSALDTRAIFSGRGVGVSIESVYFWMFLCASTFLLGHFAQL